MMSGMMSQPSSLSTLVRGERRRRGWSREQLAERAGCAAQTIQDLELGRHRRPQGHTLQRVAHALDLPVGALVVAPRG